MTDQFFRMQSLFPDLVEHFSILLGLKQNAFGGLDSCPPVNRPCRNSARHSVFGITRVFESLSLGSRSVVLNRPQRIAGHDLAHFVRE
ncbi:hypothetical protein D3C87_1484510 [compost metagenome]